MGYIPTPKQFLHRAFEFLKKEGGILYYHHTCTKEEYRSLATEHIKEELNSWNILHKENKDFKIIDFRVVKSYSPKQWHCVADVHVFDNKSDIQ